MDEKNGNESINSPWLAMEGCIEYEKHIVIFKYKLVNMGLIFSQLEG